MTTNDLIKDLGKVQQYFPGERPQNDFACRPRCSLHLHESQVEVVEIEKTGFIIVVLRKFMFCLHRSVNQVGEGWRGRQGVDKEAGWAFRDVVQADRWWWWWWWWRQRKECFWNVQNRLEFMFLSFETKLFLPPTYGNALQIFHNNNNMECGNELFEGKTNLNLWRLRPLFCFRRPLFNSWLGTLLTVVACRVTL